MNEKTKTAVIGLLVLAIVAVSVVFVRARLSAGEEAKPVVAAPDNPAPSQRPADSPPISTSAN